MMDENPASLEPNEPNPDDSRRNSHSIPVRVFLKLKKVLRTKIALGVVILLVVDIIWVASAVISEKLFKEDSYPKPLFSVYFKTSLFTICLLPFIFWRPWHRLCCPSKQSQLTQEDRAPPLPPTYSSASPRKSCLKSPESSATSERVKFSEDRVDDPQSDTLEDLNEQTEPTEADCIVSINQETGQKEIHGEPSLCDTEASKQAEEGTVGRDSPETPLDGAACLQESTATKISESITITEPNFEPLVEKREEEDVALADYRVKKPSRVRFSQTIEIRRRKSWNDIKVPSATTGRSSGNSKSGPLSVGATALLALVFGIIWFFANYFYQLAFLVATVGVVNTLSSLSGVFVLIMSAIPVFSVADNDRITLTKIIVVIISGGGAALVGLSQVTGSETLTGPEFLGLAICYSTLGAFLYAAYLTLLKKVVRDTDRLEIPMFFGFVGLFDIFILFPVLVVWNYSQLETFELPPSSHIWTLLIVNGFVGTVLSELLWLIGSFLTSPLVGTLSLSLVTPLSITYDIVFEKTTFSIQFFIGAVLVIIAFVCVALLEHYGSWDPAWRLSKVVYAILTGNYSTHQRTASTSASNESDKLLDTLNDDLSDD